MAHFPEGAAPLYSLRNFRPSGFSKPQLGQCIAGPSRTSVLAVGSVVGAGTFSVCAHPCAGWVICIPCVAPCQAKIMSGCGECSHEPMAVCSRVITSANAASATRAERSRTRGRLYLCDAILKRLAQDLEDMALELRQLIQEQDAMVRQRHLPRQGQVAAADQAHIGDGVVGSPERAHGDDGGAPPGEAGDAMDAGGLQRVARRIAGRMGARRRASIDVPAR
jgi:hypothetical protein